MSHKKRATLFCTITPVYPRGFLHHPVYTGRLLDEGLQAYISKSWLWVWCREYQLQGSWALKSYHPYQWKQEWILYRTDVNRYLHLNMSSTVALLLSADWNNCGRRLPAVRSIEIVVRAIYAEIRPMLSFQFFVRLFLTDESSRRKYFISHRFWSKSYLQNSTLHH